MLTVAMAYITDLDPENVSKNLGLVGVALGFAFISGPVRTPLSPVHCGRLLTR